MLSPHDLGVWWRLVWWLMDIGKPRQTQKLIPLVEVKYMRKIESASGGSVLASVTGLHVGDVSATG